MGSTAGVILRVEASVYGKVTIEVSDGKRYFSDLSDLSKVYCFPKDLSEWRSVGIDSYGLSLIWASRFEAHIDQIIALAYKSEEVQKSA
ncbi:MAG: hypothetical protein HY537_13380 [Deltaproteobacteria bacterium]|nr:hypothetical protein [Deltaproteobacteria bacterium]